MELLIILINGNYNIYFLFIFIYMESLNNAPAPTMPLTIIDIYPQNLEEVFHNINEMHSIKVLMNEVDVCDLIIEYKNTSY